MKRHITYANVTATLALLFAMSGGALAAKHYLITSQSQIAPAVLTQLKTTKVGRGATGPTGVGLPGPEGAWGVRGQVGPTGAQGARGLEGPRGERGKEGGELPWARSCTALGEVVRDLEFTDQQLKEHLPPPVGPTGLIDRQESELQAKETTATALGQVRGLSNC